MAPAFRVLSLALSAAAASSSPLVPHRRLALATMARAPEQAARASALAGAPLSQVEVSVRLCVDVLDLDERRVLVLVGLAPASGGSRRFRKGAATTSQRAPPPGPRRPWPIRQSLRRVLCRIPLVAEDLALGVQRRWLCTWLHLQHKVHRQMSKFQRVGLGIAAVDAQGDGRRGAEVTLTIFLSTSRCATTRSLGT